MTDGGCPAKGRPARMAGSAWPARLSLVSTASPSTAGPTSRRADRPRSTRRSRSPSRWPDPASTITCRCCSARSPTPPTGEADFGGSSACVCLQARGAFMTEAHAGLSGPEQVRRDQQAAERGQDAGQRGNKWWTLVAVCLGTFMLLLDITIVNVALPDIQRALHSSFSDLQWVVDAYALTLAAFLLTAGSLADMYGRRLL